MHNIWPDLIDDRSDVLEKLPGTSGRIKSNVRHFLRSQSRSKPVFLLRAVNPWNGCYYLNPFASKPPGKPMESVLRATVPKSMDNFQYFHLLPPSFNDSPG